MNGANQTDNLRAVKFDRYTGQILAVTNATPELAAKTAAYYRKSGHHARVMTEDEFLKALEEDSQNFGFRSRRF